MTRIPGQTTEKEVLIGIEDQLKQLTEALTEQNLLLKSVIGQPDGRPARFLTSLLGAVEILNF